jgi:hypothetical protein
MGAIALALASMGAGFPPALETLPDNQIARKEYRGFQDEQPGCDFRFLQGWFFWYIDSNNICHTVPVNSEMEAERRAIEILEHSFSVITSGYGFGDVTQTF